MCRLGEHLIDHNDPVASVLLLLYVGELLHKNQRVLLRKALRRMARMDCLSGPSRVHLGFMDDSVQFSRPMLISS